MSMPDRLVTALDAEQDGSMPLTYKAEWMACGLSPEFRAILRNVDLHHKYQEGFIRYLQWVSDHPNQNPPTKLAHDMLEAPDPTKPSQFQCPRKGCKFIDTRARVSAHVFAKDHARLPTFHCYHNNASCKRFFRVSERDRHRRDAHGILRPRERKQAREAQMQGGSQSFIQVEQPDLDIEFSEPPVDIESSQPPVDVGSSQILPPLAHDTYPFQPPDYAPQPYPSDQYPGPIMYNEVAYDQPTLCPTAGSSSRHPNLGSSSFAQEPRVDAHVNTTSVLYPVVPGHPAPHPILSSVTPSTSALENGKSNDPGSMGATGPTPAFISSDLLETDYLHYSSAVNDARNESLDLQGVQPPGPYFPFIWDSSVVYPGICMGRTTDNSTFGSTVPLYYPIAGPSSRPSFPVVFSSAPPQLHPAPPQTRSIPQLSEHHLPSTSHGNRQVYSTTSQRQSTHEDGFEVWTQGPRYHARIRFGGYYHGTSSLVMLTISILVIFISITGTTSGPEAAWESMARHPHQSPLKLT